MLFPLQSIITLNIQYFMFRKIIQSITIYKHKNIYKKHSKFKK